MSKLKTKKLEIVLRVYGTIFYYKKFIGGAKMEAQELAQVDSVATESTTKSLEGTYDICVEVVRKQGKSQKTGKDYDFLIYEGYDKNGKRCKFKFTKDADGYPKKEGVYTCTIDKKLINRDKQSRYNEYWVRGVEKFEVYDGFVENTEELPF